MDIRSVMCSTAALVALTASGAVFAQVGLKPAMSEQDLRNHLIWNSPWEGRASTPPNLYSYRTVFRARREILVAEIVSLSTNQKADSVVNVSGGGLTWQDSGGAEVNVLMGESGELVGTALEREQPADRSEAAPLTLRAPGPLTRHGADHARSGEL